MYIGTLTADEMSFAGATGSENYTLYLMNSYTKNNELIWWGLSPSQYVTDYGNDHAFLLVENGGLYSTEFVANSYLYRSAISLKSNVLVSGGNGTKENPYEIAD